MASTGTVVRARSTEVTPCLLLCEGYAHLIESRPSLDQIRHKLLTRNGRHYVPVVTFKNGEKRSIVVTKVTTVTDDVIEFEGVMANGNYLAIVSGAFRGASAGHVSLQGFYGS